MKLRCSPAFLALVAVWITSNAYSQTVSSPVVGFVSQTISGGTDTIVKIGFQKAPVFAGRLTAPAISFGGPRYNLYLNGTVPGPIGSLAGSHYVLVTSGSEKGRVFPVVAHTSSDQVVIGASGAVQLAQNDGISIIPSWTLETFIPADKQPADQKASGVLPPERRLELYLYSGGEGINYSPSRVFFLTDSGWKESAAGFPDASSVVLSPSSVMVLRSRAGSAWNLVTSGTVNQSDSAMLIETRTDVRQDTVVGLNRPVDVTLDELGLNDPSVFRESASTSAEDRQDELLIIDNSGSGQNREPAAVFFRTAGAWRKQVAGFPVVNGELISAESGIIIRKAPTQNGEPVVWTNPPNYP